MVQAKPPLFGCKLAPISEKDAQALLDYIKTQEKKELEFEVHFIISEEKAEQFVKGEKDRVQAVYYWDDDTTLEERQAWMKENVWNTENPKILEELAKRGIG